MFRLLTLITLIEYWCNRDYHPLKIQLNRVESSISAQDRSERIFHLKGCVIFVQSKQLNFVYKIFNVIVVKVKVQRYRTQNIVITVTEPLAKIVIKDKHGKILVSQSSTVKAKRSLI